MQSANLDRCYENPESVALYGNLNDWHHALGTGPYFTTDYVTTDRIPRRQIPIIMNMTSAIRRTNSLHNYSNYADNTQ